jgi:transposase
VTVPDLLGLSDLQVAGAPEETATMLRIPVAPLADPACSRCDSTNLKRNGKPKPPLEVADTPMRGKPVVLVQERPQLVCKDCGAPGYTRSKAFHPTRGMTNRLVRYIENAVVKRDLEDVAKELALSGKQITTLAMDLLERLHPLQPNNRRRPNHRFNQPDIVAMDGIQCNDTRFQIISDGRTGKPLAVSPTWEADPAWKALTAAIDVTKVNVFVTDMHVTNKSLATTLREKCQALHVADRFHVIHACNQAVSRVINHEVNKLRSKKRPGDATDLIAMKAKIEGKRTAAEKDKQIEFDFDRPPSIIAYPDVLAAHRARMQLIHFYSSTDRETARRRLVEFDRRASIKGIAERFAKVVGYIDDHREQVLNYFDALEQDANGEFRGFDTSRAERRNADIKDIWRSTRGTKLDLFTLRVLYHPYTFGTHIVEHGCGHFEGPFPAADILARSHLPVSATATDCPACSANSGIAAQPPGGAKSSC